MTALALYEAPPVDYGDAEAEMVRYREAGTKRALALDNRGPLRFGPDGALEPASWSPTGVTASTSSSGCWT